MRNEMTIKEAEKILGLIGNYNEEDARKAFHTLVKKYHPDLCAKNGISKEEAEKKMVDINNAKTVIDKAIAIGNLYNDVRNGNVSTTAEANATTATATAAPKEEPKVNTEQNESYAETRYAETPQATNEQNKKANRFKKEAEWENTLFYTFLERFPLFIVFVIAAWILPFNMVGTNPHVTVQILDNAGMNFLIFYIVLPIVALVNFLIPVHPIDWIIHKVTCGIYKGIRGAIYDMNT